MRNAPIIAASFLTAAAVVMSVTLAQQPPATAPRPAPRPAPAPHAQPPAPAPHAQAPVAPTAPLQEPERTTATYGDWVVRCETQPGPPPVKTCDMEQLAQAQGQANPISRVAIPLPAKGQPVRLIIQVPVNVSLSAPIRISADNKDQLTVPFRRCILSQQLTGCFADIELKDDEIKRFRAETAAGKLLFKDAADRDFVIPLSFKGFGQAFDALFKQ